MEGKIGGFTDMEGQAVKYGEVSPVEKLDGLGEKYNISNSSPKAINVEAGSSAFPILQSCPVEIPKNAKILQQTKNGYNQIKFRWSDSDVKMEVRWHTRMLGSPKEQGDTWVVTKTILGSPEGRQKAQYILTSKGWGSYG